MVSKTVFILLRIEKTENRSGSKYTPQAFEGFKKLQRRFILFRKRCLFFVFIPF